MEPFKPTSREMTVIVMKRSGEKLGLVFMSADELREMGQHISLFKDQPPLYVHKVQDGSKGRPARALVSPDKAVIGSN